MLLIGIAIKIIDEIRVAGASGNNNVIKLFLNKSKLTTRTILMVINQFFSFFRKTTKTNNPTEAIRFNL